MLELILRSLRADYPTLLPATAGRTKQVGFFCALNQPSHFADAGEQFLTLQKISENCENLMIVPIDKYILIGFSICRAYYAQKGVMQK